MLLFRKCEVGGGEEKRNLHSYVCVDGTQVGTVPWVIKKSEKSLTKLTMSTYPSDGVIMQLEKLVLWGSHPHDNLRECFSKIREKHLQKET